MFETKYLDASPFGALSSTWLQQQEYARQVEVVVVQQPPAAQPDLRDMLKNVLTVTEEEILTCDLPYQENKGALWHLVVCYVVVVQGLSC